MTKKGFGVVAALIATASVALANPGDYEDGSYHHMMHVGERLQIANARSWGPAPECASTGAKVVLTRRPAHGALSMDRVTTTVPGDRGECAGRPVATWRVFYTPSRGYNGEDHVSYDEVFGNGGRSRHVDEDIEVAPP